MTYLKVIKNGDLLLQYDGAVNKSDIMQHADVFFEWAQTKLGYDDDLLGALEGWFKTEAMDEDGVVNQMMKMCEMRRRIKEHMAGRGVTPKFPTDTQNPLLF